MNQSSNQEISPSGKYKMEISSLKTLPGTWKYTVGKVIDNTEQRFVRIISVVHRNYESFPFGWYENHKDGHDYLVCGFDYQGLTVIRLDTRERMDWVPKNAVNGGGFCHSGFYEYRPKENTIKTEGCFWACPYEYVTYDFSVPMSLPWPEKHREPVKPGIK
jgi:hypothetical protein